MGRVMKNQDIAGGNAGRNWSIRFRPTNCLIPCAGDGEVADTKPWHVAIAAVGTTAVSRDAAALFTGTRPCLVPHGATKWSIRSPNLVAANGRRVAAITVIRPPRVRCIGSRRSRPLACGLAAPTRRRLRSRPRARAQPHE